MSNQFKIRGLENSAVILFLSVLVSNEDYFQQHVDYEIDVKLNDYTNTLSAFEKIIYKNNSNDTKKIKFGN